MHILPLGHILSLASYRFIVYVINEPKAKRKIAYAFSELNSANMVIRILSLTLLSCFHIVYGMLYINFRVIISDATSYQFLRYIFIFTDLKLTLYRKTAPFENF